MYYRLRRVFVPVALPGSALLFRSDTRSYRVEGTFAELLASRILPLLDGRASLDQVAQIVDIPRSSLEPHLKKLADAGVMESGERPFLPADDDPRSNLVESLGVGPDEARARLAQTRLAVFGLEGLGEIVVDQLLALGFRQLLLVDPVSSAREDVVASKLGARHDVSSLRISGAQRLDRETVLDLARGSHLLIACWDKGYESGNHWANRASVELVIPALFCSLGGMHALAGPFVIPGATACYMCARMRAVAASENYEEAMAAEQFFDGVKQPSTARREFFPTSLSLLASLVATEIFKFTVLQYQPALLGTVIEFDPITLDFARHSILEQPHCPVCRKKNPSRDSSPAPTSSYRNIPREPSRDTP
jgi:bacteriocin biosynthesis cyclodehydratase domain-containing protein